MSDVLQVACHAGAAGTNRCRLSPVGQRTTGIDLVRQHQQPADATRLT